MQQVPLIQLKQLSKYFDLGKKAILHAVEGVTLDVQEGETLGLVGESGCGKSTLGRTLIRLYSETSGEYYFRGQKVPSKLNQDQRKKFSREIQMIFQDPYASLDPRMTVGDIIAEGPDIHNLWPKEKRQKMIEMWLERVGLHAEHASRFPHEFSGGQRQRIGIARAFALQPKVVVCDEPISALDVSVQAQIVTLLKNLQKELQLTYIFIAHGLSMVRYVSDRMAVMYLGQLVEIGPAELVYNKPLHPYTEALITANPEPDPRLERNRERKLLTGEVTSPINPKIGCRFASRCPFVHDRCNNETPSLREVEPSRFVACHLR